LKKIVIVLFVLLVALKLADVFITAYALSFGAVELNPLGFNSFSLTLNALFMSSLIIIAFVVRNDLMLTKGIIAGFTTLIGIYTYVVSHNVIEVVNFF